MKSVILPTMKTTTKRVNEQSITHYRSVTVKQVESDSVDWTSIDVDSRFDEESRKTMQVLCSYLSQAIDAKNYSTESERQFCELKFWTLVMWYQHIVVEKDLRRILAMFA